MFTGIIQSIGEIAAIEPKGDDARVRVLTNKLDLDDVQLGDSIAVNGVCLTAVELPGDGFWADVSGETLSCTTFKSLSVGTKANLEKALTPTTRLGGHLVSGHVDGIGKIVERFMMDVQYVFIFKHLMTWQSILLKRVQFVLMVLV